MTQHDSSAPEAEGARAGVIPDRYEQLGELGGGGMADVYQVRDRVTGRRVALKRVRSQRSEAQTKRVEELFAREFHTLVQLKHPRIVEVYDYGRDAYGPYYTMELLDGGDLQALTPVDYRRACAIASDVCSALSLLHSRRIVHRDVSPRNIRCTSDGLAKLIDFGGMTHMGPSKELVGTPVYSAPEVVNMQTLDARTDLYALGATLYYALTHRHPYPVRDFRGLHSAWSFGLARPSELVSGIPEALDALVLDLLQLQQDARPSNAAEVMARLGAIAGVRQDEQLLVAQAYLATPAFVGRERELIRINSKAARARRGGGAAVLVEGPAGCGRSRMLDASLLDGKLLGVTVGRADADDGEAEYGVVRRLLLQLRQVLPEVTRELTDRVLPVLRHVVPELLEGRDSSDAGAKEVVTRPELQACLQQVFLGIAARAPILLAVDDMHAIDEPSMAVLGVLAQQIRDAPLVIVGTAVNTATASAPSAFKLFADAASRVPLRNLTPAESESLLASVFGSSPALAKLAPRLHALAAGGPRDMMRFAQHLVDSGRARYEAGSWSLQSTLDPADLPSSITQLLSSRLAALPDEACDLARMFALCPDKSFGLEECAQLSERAGATEVQVDLDQLTQADILRSAGARVVLADRAWIPLLCAGLTPERERALHLRLARVLEARQDDAFRHAQHLLRGGETTRALDAFVAHAIASRALTDRDSEAFHELLQLLPADWFETYESVLPQLCALGRPKRDELAVRMRLAGLVVIAGVGHAHVSRMAQQFKHACGLTDWEQLGEGVEPGTRLRLALEAAQARWVAAPEDDRIADPLTAIRELANATRMEMYYSALAMDLNAVQHVVSLQPLIVLAPALGIVEQLVHGVRARLSGRVDRAQEIYRELLERLTSPESTGLSPTHFSYTRLMILNGLAVLDAASGRDSCLEAADQLAQHPALKANAWLIRMVHQLWQGDTQMAERHRKQFDMLRVQTSAAQSYESVQLTWQLIAHAAMEDLTHIKRSLDELAPLAARFPAFQIVIRYGEAEYQRIRGDSASALDALTQLLAMCQAGSHQIWPQLAAAHVRALDAAGETARAAERGRAYLSEATRTELGASAIEWISLALCVVEAKLGRAEAAPMSDELIARCLATGATGLKLGLAYEARARVAILQGQTQACEQNRRLCEQEFAKASNPALLAKLQKLKRDTEKSQLAPQAPQLDVGPQSIATTVLRSRLGRCSDAAARAPAMLSVLLQQSGANAGHLYLIGHDGPAWAASAGGQVADDGLLAAVREYVMAELEGGAQSTGASEFSAHTEWTAFGDTSYRPVLLSHYIESRCAITGLALLAVAPDRPFTHPAEMAAQISRMAHEIGDATALVTVED